MSDPSIPQRGLGISQVEQFTVRIHPDDLEQGTFMPALRALETDVRMREETSPFAVTVHVPVTAQSDGPVRTALASLRRTITAEGGVLRTVWTGETADRGDEVAAV